MKDKMLNVIPEGEASLRDGIQAADTALDLLMVLLQYVGPGGQNYGINKRLWPDWLVEVENIYVEETTGEEPPVL